jgi:hypothetical protein
MEALGGRGGIAPTRLNLLYRAYLFYLHIKLLLGGGIKLWEIIMRVVTAEI